MSKARFSQGIGGIGIFNIFSAKGVSKTDYDLLHTSSDNDKDLVLGIVKECRDGNYERLKTLTQGGGLEWIRTYARVSDSEWKFWKANSKRSPEAAKKAIAKLQPAAV